MSKPRRLDMAPTRRHYLNSGLLACAMVLAALLIGMLGYRVFNREAWVDAFLDAAMILGGMGPVSTMQNSAAKIFAGLYALFAGLVFIGSAAVLVSPWLHRLLYRLHAEDNEES